LAPLADSQRGGVYLSRKKIGKKGKCYILRLTWGGRAEEPEV